MLSLFFTGCVHNSHFSKAEEALKNKNWDVAVAEYAAALARDPNDPELKLKLNMAKIFASRQHYEEAKRLLEKNNLEQAVIQLEMANSLDPENKGAAQELARVQQKI